MSVNIFNPMDILVGKDRYNERNIDLEKLMIFVDLKAYRRGTTNIIFDSKGLLNIQTSSDMNVNMMGVNTDTNNYTTGWSKNFGTEDSNYEGFGITNIKIKTNSSYIPQVTIEFVDIRGLNFTNRGENSPYAVLYDFPPPIFELTVKGYYGKPMKYSLHLVKQNTRFDSSTGNYMITADFIANTFAPLTDILFQYIVKFPLINTNEDLNFDTDKAPKTTFELIRRMNKLYKNVGEYVKKTEDSKGATEYNRMITKINESIRNIESKRFIDNSKIDENAVEFFIYDTKENKTTKVFGVQEYMKLLKDGSETVKENYDEKFIIIIRNTALFNETVNGMIKNIESYSNGLFNPNDYNKVGKIPSEYLQINDSGSIDETDVKEYKYLEISVAIAKLLKNRNKFLIERDKKISKVNQIIDDYVEKNVGFKPTIRNIIGVICNDIDEMFSIFRDVDKKAVSHHKTHFSKFKNKGYRDIDNNSNFYSFPLFVESKNIGNNVGEYRVYPKNSLFSDIPFPETQLVDDFINVYLNVKRKKLTDELMERTDDKNNNIWFPINIKDTILIDDNISMKSPYIVDNVKNEEISNKIDLFFKIICDRFLIMHDYTYPNHMNDKSFINMIAEAEAINISNSIIDEKYIIGLKNELEGGSNKFLDKIIKSDTPNRINISQNGVDYNLDRNNNRFIDIFNGEKIQKRNEGDDPVGVFIKEKAEFKFKNIFKGSQKIDFSKENIIMVGDDKYEYDKTNSKYFLKNLILFYGTYRTVFKEIHDDSPEDLKQIETLIYVSMYDNLSFVDYSDNAKNHSDYINNFKSGLYQVPQIVIYYIGGILKYGDNDELMKLYKSMKKGGDSTDKTNAIRDYNLFKNIPNDDKIFFISKFEELENDSEFKKNMRYIIFQGSFTGNDFYNKCKEGKIDVFNEIFKERFMKSMYIAFYSENVFKVNSITSYSNMKDISANNNVKEYFKVLLELLNIKLPNVLNAINKEDEEFRESIKDDDIKTQLYYSFKNISDKWVRGFIDTDNYPFNKRGEKLIDKFIFVDRAMNDIGDECIIDARDLAEMGDDTEINVFMAISRILSQNGFEFFPLQNFINHNDKWEESFKIYNTINSDVLSSPSFICMYIGGTSSTLATNNSYIDDGLIELTDVDDFNTYRNPISAVEKIGNVKYGSVNAFRVKYGDSNQSIFYNFEIDSKENPENNESLAILSSLANDESNSTPVPKAQNLYSLYENRSYMSKITMLGNMMIQPTLYYQLENINLFSGAYIVLNVEHDITPNHMTTMFNGTRILKYPNPIITDFTKSIGLILGYETDINSISDRENYSTLPNSTKYNAMNGNNEKTLKI